MYDGRCALTQFSEMLCKPKPFLLLYKIIRTLQQLWCVCLCFIPSRRSHTTICISIGVRTCVLSRQASSCSFIFTVFFSSDLDYNIRYNQDGQNHRAELVVTIDHSGGELLLLWILGVDFGLHGDCW